MKKSYKIRLEKTLKIALEDIKKANDMGIFTGWLFIHFR